jgi:MbtH protein
MSEKEEAEGSYRVVVNVEGQYSIWPDFLPIPAGWTPTGFEGAKGDCLAHVDAVWSDMTPRSARRRIG